MRSSLDHVSTLYIRQMIILRVFDYRSRVAGGIQGQKRCDKTKPCGHLSHLPHIVVLGAPGHSASIFGRILDV